MEKLLDPYDKECMKMAMLKHEETFKQQVYELHRLYRIQKILMKRIDTTRPHRATLERLNSHHQNQHKLPLDLERPAGGSSGGYERRLPEMEEEENAEEEEPEIKLTLGPSSYYRNKNGEKPRNSGSGKSFSSSSTTGSSSSHMQSGKKNRFDVEQQFIINQERMKQPSWLFQPLSLNMS